MGASMETKPNMTCLYSFHTLFPSKKKLNREEPEKASGLPAGQPRLLHPCIRCIRTALSGAGTGTLAKEEQPAVSSWAERGS